MLEDPEMKFGILQKLQHTIINIIFICVTSYKNANVGDETI